MFFCVVFSCEQCGQRFHRSIDIGRHFSRKSLCHATWRTNHDAKAVMHRVRPTITTKCRILDDLVKLEEEKVPMAQTVVRILHPSVSAKNISNWSSDRTKLFLAREMGLGHCRSLVLANRVQFPCQEDTLYMTFSIRRKFTAQKTGDDWLVEQMGTILDRET